MIRRPRLRPVAVVVAAAALIAACGGQPRDGSAETRVVAAFYPLFEAAQRVGGDRVEATDLTPPGAEPHDLELSSDRVEALLDADLVVYAGGGFQPGVEEVVARREGRSLDVLAGVPGDDPHVWLDPVLWAGVVGRIAEALAEVDPGGAAAYRRNAEAYRAEVEALDERFRAGLAGCARDLIVTAHDAFGRLAARYGLRQEPIGGRSPEAEPDPERLAELAAVVEDEGVTTVFAEPLLPAEAAESLARETGARVEVLDPIEGLTEEQRRRGETYALVMERNLEALRRALGCP